MCSIGHSSIVFSDDAETDPSKWSFSGGWGKSSISHAGKWSFTDSPSGNYPDNSTSSMTLLAPVQIPDSAGVSQLRFWSRWDAEPGYDYGLVSISSDGGRLWLNVNGDHATSFERLCYTGWQPDWVEESISLADFAGKDILVRFEFTSDVSSNADGWYIDDIRIQSFLTTTVRNEVAGLPEAYQLAQNYPNPFNPRTGVRFQVLGVSDVKITVFDLLGREVAVLVNERKQPGTYEVMFEGGALASGVYLYKFTAGAFMQTRKMILVK
jgi:hypothetical protein